MRKSFIFALLLFYVGLSLHSQTPVELDTDSLLIIEAEEILGFADSDSIKGWRHSGIVGFGFGHNGVSNWVGGGSNSVSADTYINASLEYRDRRYSWDNYLFLNYGTIYSKGRNWQKAADKISASSMIGYHNNRKWAYGFLIDFSTQFNKGYIYPEEEHYKSRFMAPAYSSICLGISYKSNNKFAYYLSPINMRTTFALDKKLSEAGAFGVSPGEKYCMEAGFSGVISTSQHLWNSIDIVSKLDLFTPYTDRFMHFDFNWDILLIFKLKSMLSCSFNATLRYFEKEIPRLQARDVLGIGLSYTF